MQPYFQPLGHLSYFVVFWIKSELLLYGRKWKFIEFDDSVIVYYSKYNVSDEYLLVFQSQSIPVCSYAP